LLVALKIVRDARMCAADVALRRLDLPNEDHFQGVVDCDAKTNLSPIPRATKQVSEISDDIER
jgi:hypothetical protein